MIKQYAEYYSIADEFGYDKEFFDTHKEALSHINDFRYCHFFKDLKTEDETQYCKLRKIVFKPGAKIPKITDWWEYQDGKLQCEYHEREEKNNEQQQQ